MPITVRIGAATLSGGAFQASALVASADAALYQAKNTGRNRVCMADETPSVAAPTRPTASAIQIQCQTGL